MKPLYKYSMALIFFSGAISLFLFMRPVEESFSPHWALPLISLICLLILFSSERGPKPKNIDRGFWVILLGMPILGILFQFHYLSSVIYPLSIFKHELVPILGFHVFLAATGNYVTTSKTILSGIPTPWNLRSDLSWRKSHLVLGLGTVMLAFISAIAAIRAGQFQDQVLAIGGISLLIGFAAYSWWVWRNDPDRKALLGT